LGGNRGTFKLRLRAVGKKPKVALAAYAQAADYAQRGREERDNLDGEMRFERRLETRLLGIVSRCAAISALLDCACVRPHGSGRTGRQPEPEPAAKLAPSLVREWGHELGQSRGESGSNERQSRRGGQRTGRRLQ